MVKLLHGTSADNLDSILEHGIIPGNANWICSHSEMVYFWDIESMDDYGDDDEDEKTTYNSKFNQAFQQACWSAEFSLYNSVDCRRVVIEVDIPKHFFTRDYSCQNMSDQAVESIPVDSKYITRIWVDKHDLSWFKPYFAIGRLENDLSNGVDLNTVELLMVKALQKSEDFRNEAFEVLTGLVHSMELIKE